MKGRIVIVGGGFGGLTAAVRLASLRKKVDGCSITLIDKAAKHLYFPLLYEVATGWFDVEDAPGAPEFRHAEHELMKGAAVDFTDLKALLAPKGIEVMDDEVVGLEPGVSRLKLADGRDIPYDQLVIAVGSVANTFGIPGVEEHAHSLYSMRGALGVRRRLRELVALRRRNEIPHIRVVVGGAGPTGVEFACELAGLFRKLARKGVLTASDWTVEMVEASPRPLGGLHPELSRRAKDRLEKLGVKIFLDTCIKGAHKDHLVLAPRPLREGEKAEDLLCDFRKENEKEITYDLLVWTGGSKASPVLAAMRLPLDARGRIEVEPTLKARGLPNVWAVGDAAALVDPKTDAPVPPLAQAAIAEARTAAENVWAACREKPPKPYPFPRMNAIVPLGGTYGLADVHGLRLRGRAVFPLKVAAEARYFFRTLPFGVAMRMLGAALRAYRRND